MIIIFVSFVKVDMDVNLRLPLEHVNVILKVLAELPIKSNAIHLINNIQDQVAPQVAANDEASPSEDNSEPV